MSQTALNRMPGMFRVAVVRMPPSAPQPTTAMFTVSALGLAPTSAAREMYGAAPMTAPSFALVLRKRRRVSDEEKGEGKSAMGFVFSVPGSVLGGPQREPLV